MRFALRRPASWASTRSHGVPRRDVLRRVQVSVVDVAAGDAQEVRLALAVLPGDMPTARTLLTGVTRVDLLDAPRRLVLETLDELAPSTRMDLTVQAPVGTHHRGNAQILDADRVVTLSNVGGDLLNPIPAPIGLSGVRTGSPELRLRATVRSVPASCEVSLRSSASVAPSRNAEGLALGCRDGDGHAATMSTRPCCQILLASPPVCGEVRNRTRDRVESNANRGPGVAQTTPALVTPDRDGGNAVDDSRSPIPRHESPAELAAEARVWAEAGLRMLAEGECEQAARLFRRASRFARKAA